MQKASPELNREFRLRLRDEFARRVRGNERYSMRAFSLHIGLDSATLSQILAGKRQLSSRRMSTVCDRLGIPLPSETQGGSDFDVLSLDTFAVISDWYHFAILDLTLLKSFRHEPRWIARKLGIGTQEAQAAVDRLLRLGMLEQKGARLHKAKAFFTNYSEGDTSAALKEYQRQVIRKALHAVDDCPAERKDITSMTIAADSKKLKTAKEKIKKFRRELCAYLEDGVKDSVFHLTVQLYPVTTEDEERTKK